MAYTKYSLTPANNTATPPDGAPEGMLPSAVNDTMRDMMAQIRDCGDGIRDGTYTMTAAKITGGTITGITDLAIADGGTGASTAAGARTNLGLDGFVNMKNRIINGAMVIDQRNAGASVTPDGSYTLDRWRSFNSQTSKFSVQQNSATNPAGFPLALVVTSSSAYSISTTDYFGMAQPIEGYNIADLAWGSASAKTVTLSFWVRSSLTGTFGGVLRNGGSTRTYAFSYTINAANTWEQKSVTIAGETTGTWLTTNGTGIYLSFSLGTGSTYTTTAGSWVNGNYLGATGETSVVGTNGATWYVTGVQLEVGSTATSFDYRPYTTELQLCQRYFEKSYDPSVVAGGNSAYAGNQLFVGSSNGSSLFGYVTLQTPKRAQPTITIYPPAGGSAGTFDNGGTIAGSYIGLSGFGIFTTTLTGSRTQASWIASAEL